MGSVDRKPPPDQGYAAERTRAYREARLIAKHAERIGQDAEEHELGELDDAVVGTDRKELARLRSELQSPGRDAGKSDQKS